MGERVCYTVIILKLFLPGDEAQNCLHAEPGKYLQEIKVGS